MSQWLHVNGLIRVDGLPSISKDGYTCDRVIEVMGPMWLPYVDLLKKDMIITMLSTQGRYVTNLTDECQLLCGSEGSLQYRVIEYDTGLPWVSIPFWGDLRDVHDKHAAIEWFMNCCRQLQQEFMFIRDAVMTLEQDDETPTCYMIQHKTDGALALLAYD